MLRKAFNNITKYEWLMLIAMIAIGGYYAITDNTHPLWYLIINYISAIAGVCCIFLCAHASWATWYFAIVNTALYIIVLVYNRVYGTMALELLYYMPTNVAGLIIWLRHKDNVEPEKCLTRRMNAKKIVVMVAFVIIATLGVHLVLAKVGGATAWLDAMIVAIGIVATYFEIKRYADQYYLWIVTDVIAVVQWIQLADPIMITKKSIYLIMAVIGLSNWIELQKERNRANI